LQLGPISKTLPEHLAPKLRILFVGINPGLRSAEIGHHYAGPSNRFWKLLFDAELVPVPLTSWDDWQLPKYGYGLTNVIDRPTTGSQDLAKREFLQGRKILVEKIANFRPKLVALLGVGMARLIFESPDFKTVGKRSGPSRITVGLQVEPLGGARVFVLPNPSGRNAYYSYQTMKELFCRLKQVAFEEQEEIERTAP